MQGSTPSASQAARQYTMVAYNSTAAAALVLHLIISI
jgi:hypothetical protein